LVESQQPPAQEVLSHDPPLLDVDEPLSSPVPLDDGDPLDDEAEDVGYPLDPPPLDELSPDELPDPEPDPLLLALRTPAAASELRNLPICWVSSPPFAQAKRASGAERAIRVSRAPVVRVRIEASLR
jgi:hypothetical protein